MPNMGSKKCNLTNTNLRKIFLRVCEGNTGKISQASFHNLYDAVSASTLEFIMEDWMQTRKTFETKPVKQMSYLSAEFLMGRALNNNLINTGFLEPVKEVLEEMGIDYAIIEEQEPDAGLGNGGLGRLAACFLDSLATLDYPGMAMAFAMSMVCLNKD